MKDSKQLPLIEETAPAIINSEAIDSFTAFLDVAPLTVKAYTSGLKMFARY